MHISPAKLRYRIDFTPVLPRLTPRQGLIEKRWCSYPHEQWWASNQMTLNVYALTLTSNDEHLNITINTLAKKLMYSEYPHGLQTISIINIIFMSNYLMFRQCRSTWAALHFHLEFCLLHPFSADISPEAINLSSRLVPPTILAATSLLKVNLSIIWKIFSNCISAGLICVMNPPIIMLFL